MPQPDLLHRLAARYVWWQSPDETLSRQDHFLCQVLQLGTTEDVRAARGLLGDDSFRAALRAAPPGVLDARSWNYWHLILFRSPPPPPPQRPIPP